MNQFTSPKCHRIRIQKSGLPKLLDRLERNKVNQYPTTGPDQHQLFSVKSMILNFQPRNETSKVWQAKRLLMVCEKKAEIQSLYSRSMIRTRQFHIRNDKICRICRTE